MEKINDNRELYFNLLDYVSEIKLESYVLEHLEEVNESFYQYLKALTSYNKYSVIYFWLDSLYKELKHSSMIERELPPKKILEQNAFFDTLQVSHARIHKLHSLITGEEQVSNGYREKDVKISGVEDGKEQIYCYPPKSELVDDFMNSFLDVYKSNNNLTINSNPFLKSALIHLLFVKIHPYMDGNGRTARMLQNIKFTELINKMYDTKLKLCPLNFSQNINLNKLTYCKCLNDVTFKPKNEDSQFINKWFDFMLNMADEQLYYTQDKIKRYAPVLEQVSEQDFHGGGAHTSAFIRDVDKMKIKTIL